MLYSESLKPWLTHIQMFAGPMSESVPTSVASFAHRRSRADSVASFTYLQESDDEDFHSDEAILDDEDEDEDRDASEDQSVDLEAGEHEDLMRRRSSAYSRSSVHDRLLRSDSAKTDISAFARGGRLSQKIYIETEDLTIVVAGFRTRTIGFAAYITLCVLTGGLAYLLLRWLPKWQVRLIGAPCSLSDCSWVVIEVRTSDFP